MSTAPPATTAKTERELVSLIKRIGELARLNDRKVHLFIELRAQGVTQARIGELAGMSDVGVVLAINRHKDRHAKGETKLAAARDDDERATAEALLCHICAAVKDPADATEPVAANA